VAKNSIVTRLVWALQLLFISLLAWVVGILPKWTNNHIFLTQLPGIKTCLEKNSECYGAMGIYRLMGTLTIWHLTFAVVLLGVKTSRDCRASWHSNWWVIKWGLLAALLVGSFFLPSSLFVPFTWVAIGGAGIFIFIRLLLLIEFAQHWNDSWVQKHEKSKLWGMLLMVCTVILYSVSLVMSLILFVFFSKKPKENGCWMNTLFVSLNAGLCLLFSVLSVTSLVRKKNPRSGILQSAVVTVYCTYLLWSAINSEPNEKMDECGAFNLSHGGTYLSILLGVGMTILAVCYSAFRAGASSEELRHEVEAALMLDDELADVVDDSNVQQRTEHKKVKFHDDETDSTKYSYSWFHFSFATACMYIAMVLTNWQTISHHTTDDTFSVDKGMTSVWVKMIASWFTVGVYLWILLVPRMCPNRKFS